MTSLIATTLLPILVAAGGDQARVRFIDFFTANIRNRNTRRAYAQAVREFLAWCEAQRVPSITAVRPIHVAGYIEELTRARSAPTAKRRLAAIRHLFDWLVVGQVMAANPASSVRGPTHVVKRGKTPVLSPAEARLVLDAIDLNTHAGLRDRALIGLMVYSFARIGAAVAMKVDDVYVQNRRLWLRLHEKGVKHPHDMPPFRFPPSPTLGDSSDFEQVWLSRDSHLDKIRGSVEFHPLKGPEAEDHALYASHTVWENRAVFEAWTKSEAFRAAHSRAEENKPLYLDHPQFEGFEVRQTVVRGKAEMA
jgi:heme-degrading monooxygenase HmoA